MAQALDYVVAPAEMDHRAVGTSDGWRGGTLYDLVRDHPEVVEEPRFSMR